jgi:hypothetical protein
MQGIENVPTALLKQAMSASLGWLAHWQNKLPSPALTGTYRRSTIKGGKSNGFEQNTQNDMIQEKGWRDN